MRGVRGMECRVASSKRLRRAGMRVFSTPFCGRDSESLSIRARGGRHAPPPASCTRLHRAFTSVPGWPRSTGNPSSTGRQTRTPDESAAWTPSRAPGSGTNGIRLVNFAIRLRIRSWALVIRWFFIPLAGCRCRCSPSSLPLSDRFSGSPLIGPARTEPLPTPNDLADYASHGFPEGGCLLK